LPGWLVPAIFYRRREGAEVWLLERPFYTGIF